ncbi:pollen-specific leucine-rich repeat extensin-like protein 1 isoform X2 [Drosophila elegans]|uniref:pollen-specific leucine-rich repeat extensin-like protein 1 isoform X2 n=1 Tax=Drosophila elegans TaxID=30023 RepID=UPI0007E73B09|nr:pollen-specific leucine-rich repeat extensin-like protein 1 isoform X2 [Drosophila elegans]
MQIPKGRLSDWLLSLAFVSSLLPLSQATGAAPQAAQINRYSRSSHNTTDSELSASERSRRLIPYMAFYLPAPELPINQQYATKHSSSAGGAQLQAPPPGPGRIPVPVAYMPQQKHHSHHHGPPHPPPVPHYQSGAGEVYHSLAIGGHQHRHPHAPPHPAPGHVKEQQAITDSGATFIAYKSLNPTHKHKTVQHFPPLPPSPKEQLQHPLQPQLQEHHLLLHHQQQQQQQQPLQFEILSSQPQRQRAKQSKINLTPFTAQNTLPGQFIPIIYTPVSSEPGSSSAINYNNIQSNLKQPEIVYKNSHQTQIVTDYAGAAVVASAEQPSSLSSSDDELKDEAKGEEQKQQQQHRPEDHGSQEEAVAEQQHQQVQNNPSSPAPPQFIDYLIDGPRQSLDEEQQRQQHSQHERPSAHQPPQHAYILVTTTAPHIEHQPAPQLHPEISTPRPPILYNHQPTLRLQPVHNYKATRRPIYVTTPSPAGPSTPSHTVEITPKYVYISGKPPSAQGQELPVREPSTVTPVKLKPVFKYVHERPPLKPAYTPEDEDQLPDIRTSSLAEILHKLQASNHLPQTLTPDNIDNSIKTLIRILQNLKQTQTIVANPPQHHEEHKPSSQDYDYNEEEHHSQSTGSEESNEAVAKPKGPNKHPGPSTGRPGIDYPNYAEIPQTSFECTKQRYKGFFGDPETNCQVWHYCDLNGGKASFLCPNGTIFSQIALTCDWWFNVKCSTTAQLYVLNERLYKYILPFNPKFPEDYNGPIVDKYLAMKFQEMEEKMRQEKQRKATQQAEKPIDATSTPSLPKNHKPEPKHGSGINAQVYEQSSERNLLIDDEIDDISERGTYDTYEQSAPTTIMAPTSTQDTQSYVLKPIVVSSTPQPQPEVDFEVEPTAPESSEEEDKLQSLRDTKDAEKTGRETTKVSVEKLEVIEIKTDGNTGQLMPIKDTSK